MEKNSPNFFEMFSGKKTIQTFDDKGKDKTLIRVIHFDNLTASMADELAFLNDRGAGIYLCVNETDGKGRKAHNVTRVRAVYADLDGSPLEKAPYYNPSVVVESSVGRFH